MFSKNIFTHVLRFTKKKKETENRHKCKNICGADKRVSVSENVSGFVSARYLGQL